MSTPREEASLYPLFLKLEDRKVLVIGAGAVAERKIEVLVEARARVMVVAPDATAAVQQLAQAGVVEWARREIDDADADGAWLIVAATNDAQVQDRARGLAEARRVFVIAVDDPANASAYSGAVVRRPPFTVAISSSGATPALTRLLREIIEETLPGDEWIEHAQRLRAQWKADATPMGARFAALVRAFKERAK